MDIDKHAPFTKSPLDAYRGSGRHAKKPIQKPIESSNETIVLDIKEIEEPKPKKKPGRKKKEKPLIRFHISNEPITLSFD